MSVYQFVAFDTLFMYLFIYSLIFSIIFYLLRQPWRNWYRVALVIGKLRAGWKGQVFGDKSTITQVKIGL